LKIANRGRAGAKVRIYDACSRRTGVAFIGEGDEWTRHFPLAGSFGWYDFTLLVDGDASFAQQLAGHVETGEDGVTDPLLGAAR
jgi:phospholipase C